MRFPVLVTAMLIYCVNAFSREADTTRIFFYGLDGHYGFIIPHSEEIQAVSGTSPAALSISFNRLHTSEAARKVFNSYRISGVEASYISFRDRERLGGAFTLTAYAEPVIAHGRKYLFSVRGGAGFSYHTRLYDSIENPLNKFFSTNISFPLYLSAKFSYKLNRNTFLTFAGNYNHISNGGIRQPNFGMNFPTASVGIRYCPEEFPLLERSSAMDREIVPGISLLVQALWGYRVVDQSGEYPEKGASATGFHARLTKQILTFYAIDAGSELISDGAIKELIRREGSGIDHKRIALTAGHDFLFGRAVFSQSFGFYIYSPYKARNKMYHKYELAYRFSGNARAGVYIKAHAHVAELMGLNISYLFFRKGAG